MNTGAAMKLDLSQKGKLTKLLAQQFSNTVVGQEAATQALVELLDYQQAGFVEPSKPVGVVLYLGPTGTGKTHVAQSFVESLFGTKKAMIRIDCAEFQHSHEIAKLIGSPPGYLGHRETHPLLTQEALDQFHTEGLKLSVVLFDEVEKASDSLWSLMLGIMDNATLTLGDNRKVDFSNTIIIMTSNVGAREMVKQDIGFVEPDANVDKEKLEKLAISAAKSKFSPEFMNRIHYIITFHRLTEEQIKQVVEIELENLRKRIGNLYSNTGIKARFDIAVSPKAKARLIREGYSKEYGARYLKRALGKYIQRPIAALINSHQVLVGDTIVVDDHGGETLEFYTHGRNQ